MEQVLGDTPLFLRSSSSHPLPGDRILAEVAGMPFFIAIRCNRVVIRNLKLADHIAYVSMRPSHTSAEEGGTVPGAGLQVQRLLLFRISGTNIVFYRLLPAQHKDAAGLVFVACV